MSSIRDEFPRAVVDALCKRAAYICSNPDCRAQTLAPSGVEQGKYLYIGKAAHICAAAPGDDCPAVSHDCAPAVSAGRSEFGFVEHESGPEVLVYLALATAGVTLAKSVIDLIVAIIKARSEGVKNGDRPDDPVEVIIRRVDDGDKFVEEKVIRIGHNNPVNRSELEARINAAVRRLAGKTGAKTANPRLKGTRRKRRAP